MEQGSHRQLRPYAFFLDKGRVRLTHTSLEGTEKILWYLNDGCVFGETPLFDPPSNELTSVHVCVTDCRVYSFSAECVERLFVSHPQLMHSLLQSMARKLRMVTQQASSLHVDDVLARVCKFLTQRLVPGSDPLTAVPNMSRQEMANFLGVHRITLYKVLKHQEKLGVWSSFSNESVQILRPDVLFHWADA